MQSSAAVRIALTLALLFALGVLDANSQILESNVTILSPDEGRPLHSVEPSAGPPFYVKPSIEIPNFATRKDGTGANTPNTNPGGGGTGGGNNGSGPAALDQDPLLQPFNPTVATDVLTQFEGANNTDNAFLLGFGVNPPDPVIDVGPNHIVQMINLVTTMYDKTGAVLRGPELHTNLYAGTGHDCGNPSKASGDPIVLYDEQADRWILTHFAFSRDVFGIPAGPFYQCIAASQGPDPTLGYYLYAFNMSGLGGLNDYPKFGVTQDVIAMTAHIFSFNLFGASYEGQFVGVIDKSTLYAGLPTQMVGRNIGEFHEGFLPIDLDDATGAAGPVPALFATAFDNPGSFDIYRMNPDWETPSNSTVGLVSSIPIAAFDLDLCEATRERCVPHTGGGPDLETLGDRLMHRLQVRDFGTHLSMTAAVTVDADAAPAGTPGRAGIRWYELRSGNGGGTWSLQQEGTFAPADGLHRWMPSIAMNAAGDIGIGYMISSDTLHVGMRVSGQTAAGTGTGFFDAEEGICQMGIIGSDWSGRSGDYTSLNIDPVTGTFWYTGQFGSVPTAGGWGTAVCEFQLGGGPVNQAPEVGITAPADGSSFDEGVNINFTGTAGDAEDGDLSESISWSSSLDGNIGVGASVNTAGLTVGTHVITASVTDSGGAPGSAQITITVNGTNQAPEVGITAPADGSSFDEGVNINFTGTAGDAEDGDLSESISWSSSLDGNIGVGASVNTASLTVGTHVITASVTDSGGTPGSAQITITVSGASAPTSLHVDLITTGSTNEGRGFKRGFATLTIRDDLGNPVQDALIVGEFSGTFTESVIAGIDQLTDANGMVTFTTSDTARGGVDVSFCVVGISGPGPLFLPYNPGDNADPSYACGN